MKLNNEIGQQAEVQITHQPSSGLRSPSPAPASEGRLRRLEWWYAVPAEERKLLCSVMRMIRAAKGSELPKVARAAAKWETGLGCFIKVRLMGANRWQRHGQSVQNHKPRLITSSPSTSRSLPDASPNQG